MAEGPASTVGVDVHEKQIVVSGGDVDGYSGPASVGYCERRRVEVSLHVLRGQCEHPITQSSSYAVGNDHE